MCFWWSGGQRRCRAVGDHAEKKPGQVADQTAPLRRGKLLIDRWSWLGFCAPQLQLWPLHVGSPGLTSVVLCSDRLGSAAANSQHADAGTTSPTPRRRSSRVPQSLAAAQQSRSRQQECKNGWRQAGRARNAVDPYAVAWRRLRAPCPPGRGADVSRELGWEGLGWG
jgi:hypothetical protein